jgi:hypothetical protein
MNQNTIADGLIRANYPKEEYDDLFSVPISEEEHYILKKSPSSSEKFFKPEKGHEGKVYKWWSYYNDRTKQFNIGVSLIKPKNSPEKENLKFEFSDKFNKFIKLAENYDSIGEFIKSDEITEELLKFIK